MPAIGVDILGNPTSLLKAFKESEVAAAEFNGRMNALGQATRGALSATGGKGSFLFGSASFIGASAAAGILVKSAEAASDLNEQLSKSNVVFGKSANIISDWSRSTSNSIGIARRQALAAAATFGSVFVNTGRSKQQAAEFSRTLVNLAGDLASFNNASTEDALAALRSGLAGEIEPLRRFQVFLTEASVAQEALRETGKQSVTQLTQGEKILARYNLILGQTTLQQGDYSRTSQGAANQARTLQANIDDLSAELGSTFLPAVAGGIRVLNEFLGGIQKTIVGMRRLRENLKHSDTFEGFNKDVDGAAAHISDFFLKIRDGIPFLEKFKHLVGAARTEPPPTTRATSPSEEGHQTKKFTIIRPEDPVAAAAEFVKRFNAHMKGLQLKFDRAQLTKGFADDLAALNEMLRAIDRQEKRVGKTFELEQMRVSVLGQIKTIQDQIAGDTLSKQKSKETDILSLKKKQREEVQKALAAQQEALAAATSTARSLFGTLFKLPEQAAQATAFLGGSRGGKTITLPQAGEQPVTARGLLQSITSQNQGFAKLTANIAKLAKEGAPTSLLKAAREGQISADQVAAIANAPEALRKQIFGQVRRADRLITQAAKAEINTKTMSVRAGTVNIGHVIPGGGFAPRDSGDIVIHHTVNVDGSKIDAGTTRRSKRRANQRRGRVGGTR